LPFIAIVLVDTPVERRHFWRTVLVRAGCGAIVMALIALPMSGLSISNGIETFAKKENLGIPAGVNDVGLYVSLFIASQISILVFALCVVIQVAERYTARTPRLAGRHIDVVTRQGPEFSIYFDDTGEASMLARRNDAATAPTLCRGQWQTFPEGVAVRWDTEAGVPKVAGSAGLISSCGDSMIYEGYLDQISGKADCFAQVRIRRGSEQAAAPPIPTVRPAPAGTIVSTHFPQPLAPAEPIKPAIEKV
jgi:hypothetical protein